MCAGGIARYYCCKFRNTVQLRVFKFSRYNSRVDDFVTALLILLIRIILEFRKVQGKLNKRVLLELNFK